MTTNYTDNLQKKTQQQLTFTHSFVSSSKP